MDQLTMMEMLCKGITQAMSTCGFESVKPKNSSTPVFQREKSTVMDFASDKEIIRLVYSENRVHLLRGESGADLSDDSQLSLDSTYLFVMDEYDEKDVRSLSNEISEYLTDSFVKNKYAKKSKAPATVSKTAAKSGALSYDAITLASKIAGMFPELKDEIKINIDTYGEFLAEDFFVNHANASVMDVIRENNPQKLKRLFNILGEIYEDGTNDVQSLIAVTILGEINNDPKTIQQIMPYLTDTMLEPVLSVNERLSKSKSARMRLANPPAYKPKKEKRPGFLSQLMSGAGGAGTPGMPM